MKSYTDLEQSKELTKILPLESADMCWIKIDDDESFNGSWEVVPRNSSLVAIDDKPLLCWSLAALLSVLPKIQGFTPTISLYYNYIVYPYKDDLYTKADNLVDACVAMILKLKEMNLL